MFQKALAREIAAVLLFKAVALAALYFAFFAAPPGDPGDPAPIFAPQGAGAPIFQPPARGGAAP